MSRHGVFGLAVIAALIAGITIAEKLPNATMAAASSAAGSFVRSPGFGGLGAVLAAAIAYAAVQVRIDVDRSIAEKEQAASAAAIKQARDDAAAALASARDQDRAQRAADVEASLRDRWWEMLKWLFDQLEDGDVALLVRLAVELEATAGTDLERRVLDVVVHFLVPEEGTRT